MKRTMITNALLIACFGFVVTTGCFTAACAQDLTPEETAYAYNGADKGDNSASLTREDSGIGVTILAGAAAAAPYLTAPATIAVHSTIGLVAGIFLPDNADEPDLDPTVQIAANEEK